MANTTTTNASLAEVRQKVQSTLNSLIAVNRNSAEGYQMAAGLLSDEQYAQICREYAKQRTHFMTELTRMIDLYGGLPTDAQTLSSIVHDLWLNIRALVRGDDAAVLAECDRNEEVAVEIYHNALIETLPEDVNRLLRTQFGLLKGAHEHVHRLAAALQQ